MQPNEPNNNDSYANQPTGIDYLNQISAPAQASGFDIKSKIIMIVAGIVCLLALLFIGLMTLTSSNNGSSPVSLAAKLTAMQTIANKYDDTLRTTAVRDTNSSLKAILITSNQSINTILANSGLNTKNTTAQIAQLANTSEIEKRLDDAALNSTLDETYAREVTYLLQDALVTMDRLNRSTKSQATRDFLDSSIPGFKNLHKQFGGTSEDVSQTSLLGHQLVTQPSQI